MNIRKFLLLISTTFLFFSCRSTITKNTQPDFSGNWQTHSFIIENVYQQIAISEITFEKIKGTAYSFYGNSGVNTFFGDAIIKNNSIQISSNMGSTKMAGPTEAMEFEDLFLACLSTADKIELTEENNSEILSIKNTALNSEIRFTKEP